MYQPIQEFLMKDSIQFSYHPNEKKMQEINYTTRRNLLCPKESTLKGIYYRP